jgi:hypothetical protein
MAIFLVLRPNPTRIAALELDALISATHAGEVEVTDHPVEDGSNPADHKREKPETLTIEGIVSNIPLTQSARDDYDAGTNRAQSAYDQLRAIKAGADLIDVVTPRRSYSNMVLTSLSVPEDAKLGDALSFTASFKQVRVVTSQTVQVPTRLPAAKKKVKGGKKTGSPADDATKRKSLAAQGWDSDTVKKARDVLGGLLGAFK